MTGANSKENDLRKTSGITTGPGDFLTLIKLSARCTSRTVENSFSGMTSTLIRGTSAKVSGGRRDVRPTKKSLIFLTQGTQGVSGVRVKKLIIPHYPFAETAEIFFNTFHHLLTLVCLRDLSFLS